MIVLLGEFFRPTAGPSRTFVPPAVDRGRTPSRGVASGSHGAVPRVHTRDGRMYTLRQPQNIYVKEQKKVPSTAFGTVEKVHKRAPRRTAVAKCCAEPTGGC